MLKEFNNLYKFIKFGKNTKGRDFCVGDIHGNFTALEKLLLMVNFDKTKDRLFSVGDLVDRGLESLRAIEFINYDWFYAIAGNHERIIVNIKLKSYEEAYPKNKVNKEGNQWYFNLTDEDKMKYVKTFEDLPIAIQVGNVGLVHASPLGSWRATVNAIKKNREKKVKEIFWSRKLAKRVAAKKKIPTISGIKHVVVGHTIFKEPIYTSNMFFLDTGFYNTGGSMCLLNLDTLKIEARIYNK